jgi:hypothetical protein
MPNASARPADAGKVLWLDGGKGPAPVARRLATIPLLAVLKRERVLASDNVASRHRGRPLIRAASVDLKRREQGF